MSLRRSVKNFVNKFSLPVVKVREATSNDPWGPSSSLMLEIADLTFNTNALSEIMGVLWQRLNDRGKNWRHVYKSLTVVDYLLKNGSEKVIQHCREGLFNFQNLEEFRYVDDSGREQGSRICEKARQVIKLLSDEELLIQMRIDARRTRIRMSPSMKFSNHSPNHMYPGGQEADQNHTGNCSSITDELQQSEQTSSSSDNSPAKTHSDSPVPEETSPQGKTTDVVQDLIVLSEGNSSDPEDQSYFSASTWSFPEIYTRLSPEVAPQNKDPQQDPRKKITIIPRPEEKAAFTFDPTPQQTVKPEQQNLSEVEGSNLTSSKRLNLHLPSSPPKEQFPLTDQAVSGLSNLLNERLSGSVFWSPDLLLPESSLSWGNSHLQTLVTESTSWTNSSNYPAQWPNTVVMPGASGHAAWPVASTNPFLTWSEASPVLGPNIPVLWGSQSTPTMWNDMPLVTDVSGGTPFTNLNLSSPIRGPVHRTTPLKCSERLPRSGYPTHSYRAQRLTINSASIMPRFSPIDLFSNLEQYFGSRGANVPRMTPALPMPLKSSMVQGRGPSMIHGSTCTAPGLASPMTDRPQNPFQATSPSVFGIASYPSMHQAQQQYASPAFSMPYTITPPTGGMSSSSSQIMSSQYDQSQMLTSTPPTHSSLNPFL